jgi:hypothetical protein
MCWNPYPQVSVLPGVQHRPVSPSESCKRSLPFDAGAAVLATVAALALNPSTMTYHVELLPAQRQAANAGELQLQMPIPLRSNEYPDRR